MKTASYAVGDLVKVTSGIYVDAVGVVDDMHPECSTVRIHAKDGNLYAYKDAVRSMAQEPLKITRPPLKK